MRRILAAMLTATAIAAIAAGCGGGSSSSTTTATSTAAGSSGASTAEAQFLKQANGICARARATLLAKVGQYLEKHSGNGQSEDERLADAYRVVLLPSIETQIAEIRSLGIPAGDEEQIESFLTTLQQRIDVARKVPEVSSRFSIDRIFKPAGELARAYGLDVCGYGEGPRPRS